MTPWLAGPGPRPRSIHIAAATHTRGLRERIRVYYRGFDMSSMYSTAIPAGWMEFTSALHPYCDNGAYLRITREDPRVLQGIRHVERVFHGHPSPTGWNSRPRSIRIVTTTYMRAFYEQFHVYYRGFNMSSAYPTASLASWM